MAGGKGGSTTTKVPAWIEEAGQANLARANEIAQLGHVPYMGPTVVAPSQLEQAAMMNTGQAAGAFGLAGGGMTGMEGMPQAQNYGGVSAYSDYPIYEQAVQELRARRPGQYDFMTGMYIDPVTGARPRSPFGTGGDAGGGTGGGGGGGGAGGDAYNAGYQGEGMGPDPLGAERAASLGRGGGIFDTHQGPNPNGQAGYGLGGFTSFSDMFDGGGPGKSGGKFSGGFWG
jgi:hypothetical protein